MKPLTTQQAAERLGISQPRIYQLISEGRLPAEKIGRDYLINEEDLKLVADRKVGRPKKGSGTDGKIAVKKKDGKK